MNVTFIFSVTLLSVQGLAVKIF